MKSSFRWLACLIWLTTFAASASAEEQYLDFVQGLRNRGYYDFAELYLKSLEKKPSVPPEIKSQVPYEMGMTLRDAARQLLIPEEQRSKLDEALAAFEQFVKASPNHPLAGRANSQRAGMLVEKARVDIWASDAESEPQPRELLRANARKQIAQAQGIFKTAVEQLKAAFEKFPTYIPPEDRVQHAARQAAEAEYIQAQLDLAESIYWEAQTYDAAHAKRKELLTNAMLEFEKIHTAYRSMVGGLYARLWQGKCLEEMGDANQIGAALGIYGELLKHDGSSPSMVGLKAKARQFQLICLNHDSKKDYRVVNQLAQEWMKAAENRRIRLTDTGRAIEWEQARALEQLGQDRNIPEGERSTYLNQAISISRGLARRAGPLKAPAASMTARLSRLLGRDGDDPRDFSTAYGLADELFQQAQQLSSKIDAAQKAGKMQEALQQAEALKGAASEMTRLLGLGLRFSDASTDESLKQRAELMLAVGYVYQQKPYDAAAAAQFFLRQHAAGQPEMVRLAGEIALSSLNDAYQQSEPDAREFEKRHILKLAEFLSSRWPGTQIAVGAHFSAARLFWDDKDYQQAAETWEKVPAGSDSYGAAQLKAGAAYLELWTNKSELPELERPSAEELAKLRSKAEEYLQRGVDVETKRTPANATNDDLIRGKLALAQVRNFNGVYNKQGDKLGSIDLLLADPHPIIKATEVAGGKPRPTDPGSIQSAGFASLAYQQLLRAYIGAKNIDAARDARQKLEEIGAGGDAAALTQIFVAFGRQLEEELEQLKAAGDTQRLTDVRSGFEAFLGDLYNREDSQQTFNSLLWIAETYASLGDSAEDDQAKSSEYFDRAAGSYQRILDRADSDPAFVGAEQNKLAVRLRLITGRMRQKNFEMGEEILKAVLKDVPNAPNVQELAAQLYQKWGDNGQTEKYTIALNGLKQAPPIWGWGELRSRMRNQTGRPELRQMYIDATREQVRTYLSFANAKNGDERKQLLDGARSVLTTFARTTRNVPEETWTELDELYNEVLLALGEPQEKLTRGGSNLPPQTPDPAATPTASSAATTPVAAAGAAAAPAKDAAHAEKSGSGDTILMVALVLVTIGVLGGIFFWNNVQAKKKKKARLAASSLTGEAPRKAQPAKPQPAAAKTVAPAKTASPPKAAPAAKTPTAKPQAKPQPRAGTPKKE